MSVFPSLSLKLLRQAVVAGVLALIVWEVWARLITPMLVGGPLEPAALVQGVFSLQNSYLAELIHISVGVIFYPLGYIYIARPIIFLVFNDMGKFWLGLAYGIGLWVFALYGMAHLIAGLPAFLDFHPITWASLVGHVLYALVLCYMVPE
ncbi:hypothetical protein [Polycladidibacter stylochi]|uniref:hypothetical protein n=1 Tax=Polycladidibacter stylochi TaxID=1807766 RepID=UPI001FCB30AC|nr:hypothetical protein [Pseudovibrio stylochi]